MFNLASLIFNQTVLAVNFPPLQRGVGIDAEERGTLGSPRVLAAQRGRDRLQTWPGGFLPSRKWTVVSHGREECEWDGAHQGRQRETPCRHYS